MAEAAVARVEKLATTSELGVTGLKVYGGVLSNEEFLRQLSGPRGIKVFREMADNDATVGALLSAVELMIRPIDWHVEPSDENSPASVEVAEFIESLTGDCSHTWEDFIAEALTMLVYGWAYFEVVLKQRVGPFEVDPTRRSQYTDGRLGIRKLAPRAQDTLVRWMVQPDGGIDGMVQAQWGSVNGGNGGEVALPIERCLLFRTTSRKNSPEGRSILRTGYRAWYLLKIIQDSEAIGIERELAGLPVVSIPGSMIAATSGADVTARAAYEKVARDIKFNEQGGLVIPSDVYQDSNGNPTGARKVEVKLLSSGGTRAIDTNSVVARYQRDIARSVLADFLMLGSTSVGSFALSHDKTDLFLRACETYTWQIASVLNRHLVPRMMDLNGLDRELTPTFAPGRVAPEDLDKVASFLERMARTGMELFPDDNLDQHLRSLAGLPERGALTQGAGDADDDDEPPLPGERGEDTVEGA
jgi:hypothetical protein